MYLTKRSIYYIATYFPRALGHQIQIGKVSIPNYSQRKVLYNFGNQQTIQKFLARGKDQVFVSQEYGQALKTFDEVLKLDPKNLEAINYKGQALYQLNHPIEAEECFRIVEQNDRSEVFPDLNHMIGNCLQKQEKYEESIEFYDRALRQKKLPQFAYYYKGNSLVNLKKYDQAIVCFDKAISINPNFYDPYEQKSYALFQLGNTQGALEIIDGAQQKFKDFFEPYVFKCIIFIQKGEILLSLEKPQEAIASLILGTQNVPSPGLLYQYLALQLFKQKKFKEALEYGKQATKLRPEDVPAHFVVASSLYQLKSLHEALQAIDIAIQLEESEAQCYMIKFLILRDLQRRDESLQCLRIGIKKSLNPEELEMLLQNESK